MVRYFLKSRPTISPLRAAQPFLLFCHPFERAIDPIGEIGNSSSRNLETATEWILPHSFNRSVRRWTPSTYECIICRSRSVTKRPQSFNSHPIPTKFLRLRNYLKTLKFNTFLKHWVTFKTYRAKVSLAGYSRCPEVQLRNSRNSINYGHHQKIRRDYRETCKREASQKPRSINSREPTT